MNNSLIKNKRGEGVMSMSFGMIFSIILIVFFIIIGGIAVNAFLKWQKNAQLGLAIKEVEGAIQVAINSENYEKTLRVAVPSGVEEVCFLNLSGKASTDASSVEKDVLDFAKKLNHKNANNFFFYAPDKEYSIKFGTIKYIDLSSKNPICISVKNGVASIKIQRTFESPLIKVSAA